MLLLPIREVIMSSEQSASALKLNAKRPQLLTVGAHLREALDEMKALQERIEDIQAGIAVDSLAYHRIFKEVMDIAEDDERESMMKEITETARLSKDESKKAVSQAVSTIGHAAGRQQRGRRSGSQAPAEQQQPRQRTQTPPPTQQRGRPRGGSQSPDRTKKTQPKPTPVAVAEESDKKVKKAKQGGGGASQRNRSPSSD
jgi:hypothetical protein